MSSINWNKGQLITLGEGDTALCDGGLNGGQLYCLFFYNSAQNDASTTVNVVWSNSQPPVQVVVPGTTAKQGLAALCFVDGDQTNTVSAAVLQGNGGAKIQAFICSVKLPTNTAGLSNKSMPLDGKPQSFDKFTRYYAVPESHWYSGRLQSNVNQFIAVQFREHAADVYVVNKLVDPSTVIKYCGDAASLVTITESATQSINWSLQGNGTQWVWMNADSIQNSDSASITVQSLAALYADVPEGQVTTALVGTAGAAHFAADRSTKAIARETLAAAAAGDGKVTIFSAYGVSLVVTYGLSSKGLHAGVELDTPVGDISLGSVTLDASHPSVKVGGSVAGFSAQVTLDYDVSKGDLTVCYTIGIPFIGSKTGCKTLHI